MPYGGGLSGLLVVRRDKNDAVDTRVDHAVRRCLDPSEDRAQGRYEVRPLGRGDVRADVDLSSNAAVTEILDQGAAADPRR
jgi:hypothetical protein